MAARPLLAVISYDWITADGDTPLDEADIVILPCPPARTTDPPGLCWPDTGRRTLE
jgi:hypothetical protein